MENKSCRNCIFLFIYYQNGKRVEYGCNHQNEETLYDRKKARFRACKHYKHGNPVHESFERTSIGGNELLTRKDFTYQPRVKINKTIVYT